MNLQKICTKNEIKLLKDAGILVEDRDYTSNELKMYENQIINYIMIHSTKDGSIDRLREQYSSIFRTINV